MERVFTKNVPIRDSVYECVQKVSKLIHYLVGMWWCHLVNSISLCVGSFHNRAADTILYKMKHAKGMRWCPWSVLYLLSRSISLSLGSFLIDFQIPFKSRWIMIKVCGDAPGQFCSFFHVPYHIVWAVFTIEFQIPSYTRLKHGGVKGWCPGSVSTFWPSISLSVGSYHERTYRYNL